MHSYSFQFSYYEGGKAFKAALRPSQDTKLNTETRTHGFLQGFAATTHSVYHTATFK